MIPLEPLLELAPPSKRPLPEELRRHYGGDLDLPAPRLFANFVTSLDGVVALGETGVSSGPAISGRNEGDRFLMGLLRALADVVLIGAATLREETGHLWTPGYIHPPSEQAYAALRAERGLGPEPRLAVLTAGGQLDPAARALQAGALILTSEAAAPRLRESLPATCQVVGIAGSGSVSVAAAVAALRSAGYALILTEGGPHVIGQLLRERLVDELFLTLSPVLAGRGEGRLGLVEGVQLLPADGIWARLASVRRQGSHLFFRYLLTEDGRAQDVTVAGRRHP